MRKLSLTLLVGGLVLFTERVPGLNVALVARAAAQIGVVGGGSYYHTRGFGPIGVRTYTTGAFWGSPGLAFGTTTGYPYGIANLAAPYNSIYYGATPYLGYYGGGYGFAYGDYPYYAPYGGYYGGYYGRPYLNGFALPPAIIPAETLYGPGPVRRIMGLDPPLGTPIVNNTTIVNNPPAQPAAPPQPAGFGVNAPGVQVPRAEVAPTNQAARERSKRQLEIGDGWFRKQQYGDAWLAYKEAARAAPDLADSYFHQAAAAVAQRRYEAAVDAVKYGLRVSKSYLDGEFRYSQLYGDNKLAQTTHREALAQAALDQPSSDLYFLMGVMLFFDDEPLRSAPFFAKAREVQAGETWHIDVFREILRRMEAQAPVVQRPPENNAPAAAPPKQAQADAAGREI